MDLVLIFGTFNPVTNGHIYLAKAALEAVQADNAVFIPSQDAFLAGWKGMQRENIMGWQDRVGLLEASLAPFGFITEKAEVLGQVSGRTIDSVAFIREKYAADRLYLTFGADKVAELETWYMGEKLIKENMFIISDRAGQTLSDMLPLTKTAKNHADHFIRLPAGKYPFVSSSRVRSAALEGRLEEIKSEVPECVYEYLKDTAGTSKNKEQL